MRKRLGRGGSDPVRGRVIVVIGSTGGIGRDLAAALDARGARLVLADVDDGALTAQAAGLGGRPVTVCLDVARRDDVERLIALLDKDFGRVDVLVHCAGIVDNTDFAGRDPASIERELRINLHAPILVTHAAIPLLRKSPAAHVITLGSLGGVMPMPGQVTYAASKFGLRGAMLSLGLSLRRDGIAVTTVLPSSVDTPMLWQEVAENGNALQFLGPPQPPSEVTACILGALARPRAEVYPNRVDGWFSRVAMFSPGILGPLLPRMERLGHRGMARYRDELIRRGDLPDARPSRPGEG